MRDATDTGLAGAGTEGERRLVTVLFADLAGYTAASETRDPELIKDTLNLCFGRLAEEIARYGGYVDKVVGDAIMALFGAPRAQEDDAGKAIAAALAMQRAVEDLAPEVESRLGARFHLRIGINSGLVVTGSVGPGAYTVTGDTVNVASRLESHAPQGSVLVGETTRRLARRNFHWGERREIEVKNRAEPVACYVVEGTAAELMRLVPSPSETPFVGRAEDLELLATIWHDTSSERVVELVGEAGIGKTRFLSHFLAEQRVDPERAVYTRADTPPRTFGPLLQLLPSLGDSLPPSLRHQVDRLAAAQAATDGGAEFAPDWLVDGLVEVLAAMSRSGPVALVLDDMHRADAATIQVVERLLPRLTDLPVLVLLLRQPYGHRPRRLPNARSITLHPLAEDDALALVTAVAPNLDASRARTVVASAGGNPLYLEVMAAAVARAPEGADIPESLQTAIVARVDDLDDACRQVIREASVFGQSFLEEPLKLVTTRKDALYDALARLCEVGLLDETPTPNGRGYSFRHSLVQQVVYEGLLRRERSSLHIRAAEALELVQEEGTDVEPEQIAYHFEQAGDVQRAASYHLVSADRADRLRAPSQARQHRRAANRLLSLASLADLYLSPRRPSWRERLAAASTQVMLAALLVLPAFVLLSIQRPEQEAITLGLPLEIVELNASSVLVAVIIGGLPLLVGGVLFSHVAAPALMRRHVSYPALLLVAAGGALLALAFVLAAYGALVLLLRYGVLDRTSSIYVGAATLEILLGDLSLVYTAVAGALALASVWTLMLRLQAAGWLRTGRIVVTPREQQEGRRWAALRQFAFLATLAGLASIGIAVAYAAGLFPGSHERFGGTAALTLFAAFAAMVLLGAVGFAFALIRLRQRAPNFRAGMLGFEVPLVCALVFGLVMWFGMREAVIQAADEVDTPGGLAAFDRGLALFPDLGMGYYLRGERRLAVADFDRTPPDPRLFAAKDDFDRAVELDPEFPAPYLARGRVLIALGDYDGAIADGDRLVELRPEHPGGYAIRALAHAVAGDVVAAGEDLNRAIAPLPDAARGWDAYFVRCLAFAAVDRTDDAQVECERVIELNPRQIIALDHLARFASQRGDYEVALDYVERALDIFPENSSAWANRGWMNRALGNYEDSERALDRAIELDPEYAVAYQYRAITRLYLDDLAGALADADVAVRLDPSREYYTRLFIARYSGELELAVADATFLIDALPAGSRSLPYLLSARGLARVELGDPSGLADLDEAVRLDPGQGALYDRRGYARYLTGDLAGASADFDEALRHLPTLAPQSRAELHYHRGRLLRELGDLSGAHIEVQEAAGLVEIPSVRRLIEDLRRELESTAG